MSDLRRLVRDAIQPTRTHGEAVDALMSVLEPILAERGIYSGQAAFDRGWHAAQAQVELRCATDSPGGDKCVRTIGHEGRHGYAGTFWT